MNKRIYIIVGTRPHFIKMAPLVRELDISGWMPYSIIHTGQHYDANMSERFFDELSLPKVNHNLGIREKNQARQISGVLMGLDELIREEKPRIVMVFGDTNSSAGAAMAASMNNTTLVHIEAGMREFDKSIPEEKNKLIISSLSDFHFAPTNTAVVNLKEMGIHDNVYKVGDIVQDLLRSNPDLYEDNSALDQWGLKSGHYYFATCHRAINTEVKENLYSILMALSMLDLPVILPLHPRTKNAIEHYGLQDLLTANINVTESESFWKTQMLIKYAKAVLTDSGGIIREAYYHHVPAIIFDTQTEWVETVREGWSHISGPQTERILHTAKNMRVPKTHMHALGEGLTAKKIIHILSRKIKL